MVYLITYDLIKDGQHYEGLHLAIKNLGSWWHYLDSTWIVQTNYNSEQIERILTAKIDLNDRLLIVRLLKDYTGYLPREAWDWLNNANFN